MWYDNPMISIAYCLTFKYASFIVHRTIACKIKVPFRKCFFEAVRRESKCFLKSFMRLRRCGCFVFFQGPPKDKISDKKGMGIIRKNPAIHFERTAFNWFDFGGTGYGDDLQTSRYGIGAWGMFVAAVIGCVTLIPGFVAFPLAASLLRAGAGYAQISIFISTLMMVGVATFPLEEKYFGRLTAFKRNSLSLAIAIITSCVIGVIMR